MSFRRAIVRWGLAAAVAAGLVGLGAAPAVAAEPLGAISGTVTQDSDGSPLADVRVTVSDFDGTQVAETATSENGGYVIEGLATGDYTVRFEPHDSGLLAEYWEDAYSQVDATIISIEGNDVDGIDASLARAGSITGTVTRDDDGTPVAGVTVIATGASRGSWASAESDAAGNYTIDGLPPGSYTVEFVPQGDLQREYWDDATDWASATLIEVADGATVGDVDAALALGGAITGTVVRSADGSPAAAASVTALDGSGEIRAHAETGTDGTYTLSGLAPGTYSIRFASAADPELAAEYWSDARTQSASTPIEITAAEHINGIDASLEAVAHLVGMVSRAADGAPVPTASVLVLERATSEYVTSGFVDVDGRFDLAVGPGTYTVSFSSGDDALLDEYWKNAYTRDGATVVSVAAGEVMDGLTAELDAPSAISGTVHIDSGNVRDLLVEAYQGKTLVASARARVEDGTYTITLPAGSYTLKASATFVSGSRLTAKPQWFDGAKKQSKASIVAASADVPVSGVDFVLNVKRKR